MTTEQIKRSVEKGRLQLNFWERVTHYGIVVFLSFIFLTNTFMHIYFGFFEPNPHTNEDMLLFLILSFSIIPFGLALISFFFQRRSLVLKKVSTPLGRAELDDIIAKVAKELKWVICQTNEQVVLARTYPGFFSGSWGERITIIFDRETVLVNSICDPEKRSSITSMGRNRKNTKKLIDEIRRRKTN